MRPCRSILALVALPLALALAACSGAAATPEAASTPAPTSVATPEATPTPAPTAVATPEAATTPEQACANGVAVAEPEAHPGLVADCEALLRARDALRGDASLDWGSGLAVADWEGVAVSGEPPRVAGLDLRGKGLTGSIPRELRRLRLGEVRLTGNALSGCVPSAFEDASGDAASLGLPWCLRYDRLDATGEVAGAGAWAILGGNGAALTTWEQLRSEAATLRVHQTDAGGNSWAPEFGAVAVNDLFEWRLADDCWVRYRVTDAPITPSGASGRWEFPVEWMTYAATGSGCTGAVGSGAVLSVDEKPANIQSPYIESPVRHGPYLVAPASWKSAIEEAILHEPPVPASGASSTAEENVPPFTRNLSVAEQFLYWRNPTLPLDWAFVGAEILQYDSQAIGYCAMYNNAEGYGGVRVCVGHKLVRPQQQRATALGGAIVAEPRMIGGFPALVMYSPQGPAHDRLSGIWVWAFDGEAGIEYEVRGFDHSLRGSNVDAVIAIARSLLPRVDARQACANGVAVADPEAHPGLVADCEALLRARDALRGEASLDWGGGLAVADWEGVAVSGDPPRVTGLDLRNKGLTGSIPRELRRLRLGEVRLGGNALSGCVPSAFEDASGDAASLGLPWCLRYDSLDAAGEVASAGEWAILGGNGEVLATWEQLRSEAATLRVHQTDAGGNSWASEFGAVSVNDLFEWRMASDCWVRYRVTGAPVAPSGAAGRWEFPVEWITYAATGTGCTGAVGTSTVLRVDEEPAVIQSPRIASPVRHGPWLMVPTDWSGRLKAKPGGDPLRVTGNAIEAQVATAAGVAGADGATVPLSVETRDVAEARRRIPFWRDPVLPTGWRLGLAAVGTMNSPPRGGYRADYVNARGYKGLILYALQVEQLPVYQWAIRGSDDNHLVTELRVIDGHAGLVRYSPLGPRHDPHAPRKVQIFDKATGIKYWLLAFTGTSRETVAIARSLLPPADTP